MDDTLMLDAYDELNILQAKDRTHASVFWEDNIDNTCWKLCRVYEPVPQSGYYEGLSYQVQARNRLIEEIKGLFSSSCERSG